MIIQIESTEKIVQINGVPARIWEGHTYGGIKIHCFITRIAVDEKENRKEFDLQLQSHRSPSPEIEAYSMRLLL